MYYHRVKKRVEQGQRKIIYYTVSDMPFNQYRIANALVTLGNNLDISGGPVAVSADQVAIYAQGIQPGDTPTLGISTGSDGNFGANAIGGATADAAVTVAVPVALTGGYPDVSRITVASYTNDALFQESGTDIVSMIVSFDAADDNGVVVTVSSLASPVIFSFLVDGIVDQAQCSFYNSISMLWIIIV